MGGVRVGFLGAGLISRMHLAFLAATSVEHTIVGVHDIVGERATAWAARTNAVVMTPDELLDSVDAVYVTTWTAAHPPLVAAAAERGVAVFCEKPLGVSAPVVAEMVDVVEQAGIVNEVGLVLRAVPAWIHVRRLVADPRAGRLMAVTFRDDQYIPNQGRYASTWRVDPVLAGRGALLEHSIHDVDVLRWVGGEVAAVSGTTREFHGHDRIDDVAVARLEFAAGGVAALTSVWHDVLERPSLRFVEFFCERLHIALDGDSKGGVRWQFTGSPVESRSPTSSSPSACRGPSHPTCPQPTSSRSSAGRSSTRRHRSSPPSATARRPRCRSPRPSRPTASSTPSTAPPTPTAASSSCDCHAVERPCEDRGAASRERSMSEEGTKFQVFRAATAPTLEQTDVLRYEGITPDIRDGLRGLGAAGIQDGSFAKILINVPGFSLADAWHKSDFPLPLHSHDVDCCYLIIAGDLQVGSEMLGKGDGFFVPAGTPYTFTTGPDGVEFIEYRHANAWNIVFKYRNPESWAKAATTAGDRRDAWQTEQQPFGLVAPVTSP